MMVVPAQGLRVVGYPGGQQRDPRRENHALFRARRRGHPVECHERYVSHGLRRPVSGGPVTDENAGTRRVGLFVSVRCPNHANRRMDLGR